MWKERCKYTQKCKKRNVAQTHVKQQRKRQGTHTERETVHKLKGTFCGRVAIVVCDIHLDFERKNPTAVPNV